MEILEAFDLTGSLRAAAELVGCDHKTVAHWVRAREAAGGGMPAAVRPRAGGRSVRGQGRGAGGALAREDPRRQGARHAVAMGYLGSERTTRRAVAEAKRRFRREHGRRTRPWVPEPGLWMQWDYGDGPEVAGRSTVLFCAWLAWSRFRVVLPLWDKTLASVVMGLRRFGGGPSYALTDHERTVSIDQVCGIAVRNPRIVSASRHYGLTIATCVPLRLALRARLRDDGREPHVTGEPMAASAEKHGHGGGNRWPYMGANRSPLTCFASGGEFLVPQHEITLAPRHNEPAGGDVLLEPGVGAVLEADFNSSFPLRPTFSSSFTFNIGCP
jgi:molybdenum-dependent DNA-binding transcriptional regulator ModE